MKLALKTSPLRNRPGSGAGFFLDQQDPFVQRDFTGGVNRAVPPTSIDMKRELFLGENCMITFDNVLRTRYGTEVVRTDADSLGHKIQGIGKYRNRLFYACNGKVIRKDSDTVYTEVGTVDPTARVAFLNFSKYLVILDGGYVKLYWEEVSRFHYQVYGPPSAEEIAWWKLKSAERTYLAEDLSGDIFPKAAFGMVAKNGLWLSGNDDKPVTVYLSATNDPFDFGNNHVLKVSYTSGMLGEDSVTRSSVADANHTITDAEIIAVTVKNKSGEDVVLQNVFVTRVYTATQDFIRGYDYRASYDLAAHTATVNWEAGHAPSGAYSIEYEIIPAPQIARTRSMVRDANLSYDEFQDTQIANYGVVDDTVKFYYNDVLRVQFVTSGTSLVIGGVTYNRGTDYEFYYFPDSQAVRIQWLDLGRKPAANASYTLTYNVAAWLDEAYVPLFNLGMEMSVVPVAEDIKDFAAVTGLATFMDSVLIHTTGRNERIYRFDGNDASNFTVSMFLDTASSSNPFTLTSVFGGEIFLAQNGVYYLDIKGQATEESLKVNPMFSVYGVDFTTASAIYTSKYGLYILGDKNSVFVWNPSTKGWFVWTFPYSISKVELIDNTIYFGTHDGKIYSFADGTYMDDTVPITTVINTPYYDFGFLCYSKYVKHGYVTLQALKNYDDGITRISFLPDFVPLFGKAVIMDIGTVAARYREILGLAPTVPYRPEVSLTPVATSVTGQLASIAVSQSYVLSNALNQQAVVGWDEPSFGFDQVDVFYGYDYTDDGNILNAPTRNVKCPVSCRCTSMSVLIESVRTPIALLGVELIWAPLRPAP